MRQKRGTPGHRKLLESLIAARLRRDLTQTELADRLGVAQTYVSKYEVGERRLDVIELILVCDQLGVDPARLLKSVAAAVRDSPPRVLGGGGRQSARGERKRTRRGPRGKTTQ